VVECTALEIRRVWLWGVSDGVRLSRLASILKILRPSSANKSNPCAAVWVQSWVQAKRPRSPCAIVGAKSKGMRLAWRLFQAVISRSARRLKPMAEIVAETECKSTLHGDTR
jgi:hypothetical protein